MSSPAVGIKDLLVGAGLGVFASTDDWGIYVGSMPDKPNKCISVFGSPGSAPNPKWLIDFPGVQVIVRSEVGGYTDGWDKAQEIKDALLGLPSQTLNGDLWVAVNMVGDIVTMGNEPKMNRPQFSLNFRLVIEPASTANSNREAL